MFFQKEDLAIMLVGPHAFLMRNGVPAEERLKAQVKKFNLASHDNKIIEARMIERRKRQRRVRITVLASMRYGNKRAGIREALSQLN